MGHLSEYEGMGGGFKVEDGIVVLRAPINQSTDLTVKTRALAYDVYLGSDLVYSCNEVENAAYIYGIIQSDIKGRVWNG